MSSYFVGATSEEPLEYWIEMTRNGSRFVGRLPKPGAAASPVHYRIEAPRTDGQVASTERYVAVVAPNESRCPEDARIAPLAPSSEAVWSFTPPLAPDARGARAAGPTRMPCLAPLWVR